MASPQELDLVARDAAAATRGAPDLTATGSFAREEGAGALLLPVVAAAAASDGDDKDGGGGGEAAAAPGAVAKASLVHAAGLRHGLAEVMVVAGAGRILLRRRPADDPLAPDTWDVSASAHLLPEDGGDAAAAARRALDEAGLAAGAPLEPAAGGPAHRRLEFKVGQFVENVVVHSFLARVPEGEAAAKAKGLSAAATKPEERVWLDKGDALRMLEDDPAVCSPFLAAGKKVWFA